MTLCPSSQIFIDHQLIFHFSQGPFVRRHRFFAGDQTHFRKTPISVITYFYDPVTHFLKDLFVRHHITQLPWLPRKIGCPKLGGGIFFSLPPPSVSYAYMHYV